MYVKHKNVLILYTCVGRDCISLNGEFKLSSYESYDTESPQSDNDLYDTESIQPYPCNLVTVYIILVELIIPEGLENFIPQQLQNIPILSDNPKLKNLSK